MVSQAAGGHLVDDELELGRLDDRQIGRLGTLEYPADVDAGLSISIGHARPITDQAARDRVSAKIDGNRFCDANAVIRSRRVVWIGCHEQCTGSLLEKRGECCGQLCIVARFQYE
jgi:hypothetical protein